MKTNDIFIVIATAAYSYLFYDQNTGINFLLFNVIIVLLFYLKDKSLITKRSWLAAAAGSLASAFFVFWWGNTLPVAANICSLIILAGLSFDPESSLLFAAFNTYISVIISIPRLFQSTAKNEQPQDGKTSILKRLLLLSVPMLVAMVFVTVYYSSNPIFAQFIDRINLDFISFNWIIFTAAGFFMMFGAFNIYRMIFNDRDKNASDNLRVISEELHVLSGSGSWLSAPNELWLGVALFAMLNLVLITVNGLDVYYMWIVNKLPEGVTSAQFLHEGTDTLIFSIVLAIAVMLVVFRGYLNFIANNKWLKTGACAWIAQNVILVITTANTNWWTIQSSGLTRKRIGVYVYLLLCIIGLITTYIKVVQRKSNWFLFRKNAWAFYGVFVLSCLFNWDGMIVNYNCKNFKSLQLDYIDRDYQTDLSYTCMASLFKYYAREKAEANPGKQLFTPRVVNAMYENYRALKKETQAGGWQSFCYSRNENLHEVERMMATEDVPVK